MSVLRVHTPYNVKANMLIAYSKEYLLNLHNSISGLHRRSDGSVFTTLIWLWTISCSVLLLMINTLPMAPPIKVIPSDDAVFRS